MTATTENVSQTWLQQRNVVLSDLVNKEKTLFKFPIFPWKDFSRLLEENVSLSSLDLSFEYEGWISGDRVLKDIRDSYVQEFIIDPIKNSELFLVYSKSDLQSLVASVFNSLAADAFFYNEGKLLGFHYYFFAEVCKVLQDLKWIPSLNVKMNKEVSKNYVFEGKFFSIKVYGNCNDRLFSIRLVLPEVCWNNLSIFVEKLKPSFDITTINPLFSLLFSLELGYSSISAEDFLKLKVGDFLLLDFCLFDADAKEDGGAFLSILGKKFFGGRFLYESPGDFKITNYSNVDVAMTEEKEEKVESNNSKEEKVLPKDSLANIPLNVVVEVGRYSITLEEFSKLAPGSVLNLGARPEHGVDLLVNGKRVGTGEIISLGDALGVRITELL